VPTAVVLAAGPTYVLVPPSGNPPSRFPRSHRPLTGERGAARVEREPTPPALAAAVDALAPSLRVAAGSAAVRAALSAQCRRSVALANAEELRFAREQAPWPEADEEREFALDSAEAAVTSALRSPVEVLISLAREEERLERTLEREARASESFIAVEASPLADYAVSWARSRSQLAAHHGTLAELLEREARRTLPNLSALVGPRVAGRLLARAGGLAGLGRLRAPRLQLLGSRRRPSAERGPRFGVIYRADRMEEVPADRRAAYARSLAALASIAARADATTHANLAPILVARRDRRVSDLQRRRR